MKEETHAGAKQHPEYRTCRNSAVIDDPCDLKCYDPEQPIMPAASDWG